MERLRTVVASATAWAARSRLMTSLRSVFAPKPGGVDNQRGQGLAEYALILALIAITAIVSLMFLGGTIVGVFDEIINAGFEQVTNLLDT